MIPSSEPTSSGLAATVGTSTCCWAERRDAPSRGSSASAKCCTARLRMRVSWVQGGPAPSRTGSGRGRLRGWLGFRRVQLGELGDDLRHPLADRMIGWNLSLSIAIRKTGVGQGPEYGLDDDPAVAWSRGIHPGPNLDHVGPEVTRSGGLFAVRVEPPGLDQAV